MNWVSIDSGTGLSLVQHQTITQTYADLLSIGPLGKNFSEILIRIQNFSFMKMHLKISSAKRQPLCPGRDELSTNWGQNKMADSLLIHGVLTFFFRNIPARAPKGLEHIMIISCDMVMNAAYY